MSESRVERSVVGREIGSYEVLARLGAGGMGEVYRAHDRKLGREVALKMLPPEFSDDPERLARFEREARALAALNHPHIAAIYGSEGDAECRALVLELVDGPTLAERLRQAPIRLPEAVSIADQVADALEAAHEKGIVHRDLKPSNVKVRPDGTVKLLDFGLAKALDASGGGYPSEAPTVTATGTRAGAILGTAGYMSPEQARGQPTDERTDIWAFGCVLYEMLAGRPPFSGETVSDLVAATLSRDPEWEALPASTPASLRRLLSRCLAKDSRRRLRHIGDARLELEEALAEPAAARPAGAQPTRRRALPWALAGAGLLAAILAAWALRLRDGAASAPVTRATVTLATTQQLDTINRAAPLALSPDGRRIVYGARSGGQVQLYLRSLDAFEATAIAGTEGGRHPFFSPDGASVAFFADGKLKRVALGGGSPVTVCDAPLMEPGGTWGEDGTIVFDPGPSGLLSVSARGGAPKPLTSRDPEIDASDLSWPHFLPGSRALLATVRQFREGSLAVLSLDSGRWRRVGRGQQAQYVSSGHIVFHAPFIREGEIHAVRFDLQRLATGGESGAVVDGVFRSEDGGGTYFAAARGGTLVYAPGGHARALVRVDRNGRRTALARDRRGFRIPRLSPDGRLLAVVVDPRPSQIWIYDLRRGSSVPFASGAHSLAPVWTPDGHRLAYSSAGGIFWRDADGRSAAERLRAHDLFAYPSSWTRDGRLLVLNARRDPDGYDILAFPIGGEAKPLLATTASEHAGRLSPDDRWLAYVSDESGRNEVYVRPFPSVQDGKWALSTDGGMHPVWSPDGRELFYVNGTSLMAVAVQARGGSFRAGVPQELFSGPFETGSPQFDVSPDGTWFAMVEADPEAKPTRIQAILNWAEELKRL